MLSQTRMRLGHCDGNRAYSVELHNGLNRVQRPCRIGVREGQRHVSQNLRSWVPLRLIRPDMRTFVSSYTDIDTTMSYEGGKVVKV